jgi:hypothetical protein
VIAARLALAAATALGVACTADAPYKGEVMTDHPVGYWRLDDAADTRFAEDSSGHAAHAVVVGAVTFGQPGALADDPGVTLGEDQWLSAGDRFDFADGTPFTLELWVYPAVIDNWRPVLSKGDYLGYTGGYSFLTTAYGGTPQLVMQPFWAGSSGEAFSLPLTAAVWTHVVVVVQDAAVDVYYDGVLAAHGGFSRRWDPSPEPFTIAGPSDAYHGGGSYEGRIDEVAVYDHALSADRIAAHYAAAGR